MGRRLHEADRRNHCYFGSRWHSRRFSMGDGEVYMKNIIGSVLFIIGMNIARLALRFFDAKTHAEVLEMFRDAIDKN